MASRVFLLAILISYKLIDAAHVRYWHKADIRPLPIDVRFWG